MKLTTWISNSLGKPKISKINHFNSNNIIIQLSLLTSFSQINILQSNSNNPIIHYRPSNITNNKQANRLKTTLFSSQWPNKITLDRNNFMGSLTPSNKRVD